MAVDSNRFSVVKVPIIQIVLYCNMYTVKKKKRLNLGKAHLEKNNNNNWEKPILCFRGILNFCESLSICFILFKEENLLCFTCI